MTNLGVRDFGKLRVNVHSGDAWYLPGTASSGGERCPGVTFFL